MTTDCCQEELEVNTGRSYLRTLETPQRTLCQKCIGDPFEAKPGVPGFWFVLATPS